MKAATTVGEGTRRRNRVLTTPRNPYGSRIYPDNPINYQLPVTTRTQSATWRPPPPGSEDNYFRVRSRSLGGAAAVKPSSGLAGLVLVVVVVMEGLAGLNNLL